MAVMLNRNTLIWKIAVPVLSLAVGGAAGFFLRDVRTAGDRHHRLYEIREGGYAYINPLLECEGGKDTVQEQELRPFQAKVGAYLRDRMRFPGVAGASVYFRELNDGIGFSIGGAERFTPASMRKVPMMMAVLKQAERDPGILNRRVRFQLKKDHNIQQTIKPSVVMMPGGEYAIGDLVRRMIVYSDNNAFMMLSGNIDPRELDRTYEKLNMRSTRDAGAEDFLSVETYASFFRILYNASYLGKELSDLGLSMLAKAEFKSGIVEGVPRDVAVAHKFGEHVDTETGRKQLHDCGIVYYPRHPYLLCVMTRGQSFEYLDDAIATISRIIYSEVNAQHRLHD
jgi:beta-lactamase class A